MGDERVLGKSVPFSRVDWYPVWILKMTMYHHCIYESASFMNGQFPMSDSYFISFFSLSSFSFGEHGSYDFYVQPDKGKVVCNIVTTNEPSNNAIRKHQPLWNVFKSINCNFIIYGGASQLYYSFYITAKKKNFIKPNFILSANSTKQNISTGLFQHSIFCGRNGLFLLITIAWQLFKQ